MRKNGQRWYMRRSRERELLAASSSCTASAVPAPYQAGSSTRAWFQAKVHEIARRSSMRRVAARRAGREPMRSSEISSTGVIA